MRAHERDEKAGGAAPSSTCLASATGSGVASYTEVLPSFLEVARACTRDHELSSERVQAFQGVFEHLVDSTRKPGSMRWSFSNSPGVERHVRELARREHRCWPELTFAVSVQADLIVWQACGTAETADSLEALYRLRELRAAEPTLPASN
ncbi:MAG: hypothetical protein QM778_24575 [Myxococcales bacterium]